MEKAFQVEACDFSGWATRNDLKCSDGRVIRHNAFKENDGIQVPLVWNHQHNDPRNVLGHAWLENREEGVYTYGFFNDTESGAIGKTLVKHGDIKALSIYANQLSIPILQTTKLQPYFFVRKICLKVFLCSYIVIVILTLFILCQRTTLFRYP